MNTPISLALAAAAVSLLGIGASPGPAGSAAVVPGQPDAAFSGDGIATLKWGTMTAWFGVTVTNGKPVVVGAAKQLGQPTDAAVARYTSHGKLDRTFSGDGKAALHTANKENVFHDVVKLPHGKLLAVGMTASPLSTNQRILLARFRANGKLDTSFGTGGVVRTAFGAYDVAAYAAVPVAKGKVVICGTAADDAADTFAFALARYLPSGKLDTSFSKDGRVITWLPARAVSVCQGIAATPDGALVAAGLARSAGPGSQVAAMVSYLPGGRRDPLFGSNGIAELYLGNDAYASDVARLPLSFFAITGRYVDAGTGDEVGFVAKYDASGHLDLSYAGGTGILRLPLSNGDVSLMGLAKTAGGKLVVGGTVQNQAPPHQRFLLVGRVRANGTLDTGFGVGGILVGPVGSSDAVVEDVSAMPDGRSVIAGFAGESGLVGRLLG